MLSRFRRKGKTPGWLAASIGERFAFAHGRKDGAGKPIIDAYGERPLAAAALPRLASELKLERYRCANVLAPSEYRLLMVEAPNVPQAEVRSAMQWRVKDMLDFPVEEATLDVLGIPGEDGRSRLMYAACARNEVIRARMQAFDEARIPLSAIDIQETAQRNLAALFEEPQRAVALAHLAGQAGLLTVSAGGELILARRLEIGADLLISEQEDARTEAFERLALEIQRTFDHFERQFRHVVVSRLLLAPLPHEVGLAAYLSGNLIVPVEAVDLREKLAFTGVEPDAPTQWRLFHEFGAALRDEESAD